MQSHTEGTPVSVSIWGRAVVAAGVVAAGVLSWGGGVAGAQTNPTPDCSVAPEACTKANSLAGFVMALALYGIVIGAMAGIGMMVFGKISGNVMAQGRGGGVVLTAIGAALLLGLISWATNSSFNWGLGL